MNLMGSEVADIAAIESMKSFITANPTCVNPPRPTGWLAGTGGGARAQGLNPMSRGCEIHALDLVSATEACCTLMWPAYRAGPPRPRSHAQPLCIMWLRVPPVHVWLHVLEVCRPRAWTCAGETCMRPDQRACFRVRACCSRSCTCASQAGGWLSSVQHTLTCHSPFSCPQAVKNLLGSDESDGEMEACEREDGRRGWAGRHHH